MFIQDFIQARDRISNYLQPTRVIQSHALQQILGYKSPIFLKLENEQPTGSFKVRGAFNVMLQLDPAIEKVIAFSSGNFAQAVAFVSSKLNKKATIVMPQNAPLKKIEGTRKYGAKIVFCGENHGDGENIVKELVDAEGYHILHPFNNDQTISGQGTIALEILETNPQIKHFFSPIGGGGLLSGCAKVFKTHDPLINIYGVEPLGAHDFYDSFRNKEHRVFEKTNTIADGLRSPSVGKLNFPILMSTVDEALAISQENIIEAMSLLHKHHNMVIEPSGAVALAGFLTLHRSLQGEVVILVSGQNVDPESFKNWVGSI